MVEASQKQTLKDVFFENLALSGKKTFVHRLIYAFEFSNEGSKEPLHIMMMRNIEAINLDYCDEILTGFMVYYTSHAINVIEGSDESIQKHIHTMFGSDLGKIIKRNKLLVIVHHINQRFFQTYDCLMHNPPVLLDKLDPNCDLEESGKIIKSIIIKVYFLCEHFTQYEKVVPTTLITVPTIKTLTLGIGEVWNITGYTGFADHSLVSILTETLSVSLPEVALLEFAYVSPLLFELRDYYRKFGTMPPYSVYHDTVFPIPYDFVPFDVYAADDVEEDDTELLSASQTAIQQNI